MQAGRAAIQAQERERRRIAQDLHDEVNQALTAVSLRLQASIERRPPRATARADRDQAAVQPGDGGAAAARPPAAPGGARRPRADPGAAQPGPRTSATRPGSARSSTRAGRLPKLTPEQQLVIYRVTQESLSNIAQHARRAATSTSSSRSSGAPSCGSATTDRASSAARNGGLGLSGMRERALLVGGQLSIWSERRSGTRVELTIA